MKKRLLLTLMVLLVGLQAMMAQTSTIRGKILDDKGDPIPGATIRVKGTNKGTISDLNGNFKLNVEDGANLSISAIGMKTTEKSAQDGMSVKMAMDTKNLRETVVTAFGIKREKRSIAYANTTVKTEQILQGQNGNAINALSGKVAGLQITSASGTPGAASFIQLRGATTFTGSNQPLIVVDGAPITSSSSTFGDPDDGDNVFLNNISGGSRSFDINPNDIENVSVLKGPAATAIYGSLAANGVILITTKRTEGKKGGVGITYSTALTWDKVNKLPKLQDSYVQGRNGIYNAPKSLANASHFRESWGPKGDTMYWNGQDYLWDGNGALVGKGDPNAKTQFTPYDNVSDFFRTGLTSNHNVSIATSSDKSNLRVSLANLKQTGIIYNSKINRTTIGLTADTKPTEKLILGTTINYANTVGTYVQQGSNLSGIMLGLLRTPINFDNSNGYADDPSDKRAYEFENGLQRTYRGFGIYDNPYYTVNQNLYNDNTNRFYGNMYATYMPLSWMSITNRTGIDYYTTLGQQNYGKNSSELAGVATGRVAARSESERQINNDLIATITPNIGNKAELDILAGFNVRTVNAIENFSRGDNLIVNEWYSLNNAQNVTSRQIVNSKFRTTGQFAQVKMGFANVLYVDLAGRLEQASSYLPKNTGQNFYPSANAAFIFSDAFKINSKQFTYGKIRVSLAKAGINPPSQSTQVVYVNTAVADGWTSGQTSPINNQVIFESSRLYDPNIKPEVTRSVEIGTELRFFNNRLAIDYTYYDNKSKDLHVKVPVPASSGYREFFTNAGVITNKGHELQINMNPIRKKDFRWDVIVNFSRNRNIVNKISDGVEFIALNGFEGSQTGIKQGDAYGTFYGTGYLRDENNNMIINDDTSDAGYGYPILDPTQKALGNVMPKWLGGINNIISFKGFSLAFLFETRQGGVIWNGTRGALASFGTAEETEGRDIDTKVFDGVYGHVGADGKVYTYTGTGSEVLGTGGANSTTVKLNEGYYRTGIGSGFVINEPFVEDASWIRLRELSLSYSLPSKILDKTRYCKGLTFGIVGRNLLLFTKYKGVDPETSLIGGGNAQGLDYFNNPGTKSFGINLKVNF